MNYSREILAAAIKNLMSNPYRSTSIDPGWYQNKKAAVKNPHNPLS